MRKANTIVLGVSVASIAGLSLASFISFAPKLVWNGSQSAPIGLYRIANRQPVLGEFALVQPTQKLSAFIRERGYLPPEIPLIKRVAAVHQDEICRIETAPSMICLWRRHFKWIQLAVKCRNGAVVSRFNMTKSFF